MTGTFRGRFTGVLLAAVVAAAGVLGMGTPGAAGTTGSSRPAVAVDPSLSGVTGSVGIIVQGAGDAAKRAVSWLGGTVTHDLPIIGGFSATVDGRDVGKIADIPGVTAVTRDGRMHVQASGGSDPNQLPSVYRKVVRGDDLALAGGAGSGVTVALIDTGVTALPDVASRLVAVSNDTLGLGLLGSKPCVNLTSSTTCNDEYGHGTFIAGLIAGNGSSSGGQYVGAAPQAKVLSVKIAGADGSSDVSDVLAAIQWVVSYKNRYGIKVLNLSLGTDSTQPYRLSPLDFAVEKAWQAGITVVVAASNRGPAAGTISKPADDPFVITVAATDDRGTAGLGDDTLPNFSSRGPTAADGLAKPDVVAPGAHLVSLAAPGSTITTMFPSAMPSPYRRGSGTSFATGIVSGLVAGILSVQPTMSPDRIKFALMSTARPVASDDPMAVGRGMVDGYAAAFSAPSGLANQGVAPSMGTGTLDADRGTVVVSSTISGTTTLLTGERTAQGLIYDPVGFTCVAWNELTFPLSQWAGNNWGGNNWGGNNWGGNNWGGSTWYGNNWGGADWYGNNWGGGAWYGSWDQ